MSIEYYTPKVFVSKELREISRDFTRPEEMLREAISNSLDAGAEEIFIKAFIDDSRGKEELVVEIKDSGVGMNLNDLQYFFDLGQSTKRHTHESIGEKGHGTKIYYNSDEVVVITKYLDDGSILKATLNEPFRQLNLAVHSGQDSPPIIAIEDITGKDNLLRSCISGTFISIRGYDNNTLSTFGHHFLKDYITWFTAWGSIKSKILTGVNVNCKLHLQGIDSDKFEEIPFGHSFPNEVHNFNELRKIDSRRPENFYVRSWSKTNKVIDYPQYKVNILFYVEGDGAKRKHNEMLKWPGKPKPGRYRGEDQYTVSDRYGIYLCKDFIPIQRKNESFADRSEWTKWHSFVNCQGFQLTANRATVDNTPKNLLKCVIETVHKIITEEIIATDEYQEFAEKVKIENGRRKAELERKQVTRRIKKTKNKLTYKVHKNNKSLDFLEPGSEQGVIWLLSQIIAIWPDTFKWKVRDIDSHYGYDLLVEQPHILTGTAEPRFIECKYMLSGSEDFNHSFTYLHQIICWDTPLQDGYELEDIQSKKCTFQSYMKSSDANYRTYYLDTGKSKIEVVILKRFLEDCFNLTTF